MHHRGAEAWGARDGHVLDAADPLATRSSLALGPGASGFRGNKETSKGMALPRILHVEIF